jgi:hypothetical protein
MVPVRFPPDVLDEVRRRADGDDRSVSAWIRRAVEDQLAEPRAEPQRLQRRPTENKKSYGRWKAGVELTDEALERMAAEAEAGLDVTKMRRRPGRSAMGSGPAETLPVRLDPELRHALDSRAAAEQTTALDVAREVLRRSLQVS